MENGNLKQFCKNCIYQTLPGTFISKIAGNLLFLEGDSIDCVYQIESGYLKITKYYESGEERVIGILGPNDYVALLAVLQNNTTHIASATVLTNAVLKKISIKDVLVFYAKDELFRDTCLSCAVTRSNLFQDQVFQSGNSDVNDRILSTLKNLYKKFGLLEKGKMTIKLPFSKSVLAELIGVRRETLSRHLTILQDEKILTVNKNEYILHYVI